MYLGPTHVHAHYPAAAPLANTFKQGMLVCVDGQIFVY